jgi:hypothetical protein
MLTLRRAAQPYISTAKRAGEAMGRSVATKENAHQNNPPRAQNRESVTQPLERERQAARTSKRNGSFQCRGAATYATIGVGICRASQPAIYRSHRATVHE